MKLNKKKGVGMSRSIEDYLKGIYTLKKKKEYSNKKLAEYLNISPASVSEMIKRINLWDKKNSNENYFYKFSVNIIKYGKISIKPN